MKFEKAHAVLKAFLDRTVLKVMDDQELDALEVLLAEGRKPPVVKVIRFQDAGSGAESFHVTVGDAFVKSTPFANSAARTAKHLADALGSQVVHEDAP